MKLYFSPGACSMAPHIVLEEAGLKYDLEKVNLKTKQSDSGDFTKVNPKGSVPTLQMEDGEILTEGAVIMQYIADHSSDSKLIPKPGTLERYRCQEWLNFIASELHKGFSPLFKADTPEEYKNAVKEKLGKQFDYLTTQLKDKNYLMGSQFTVADAYLFTILSWAPSMKIDMTRWPALMGFMERVKSRPTVMNVMKSEGLKH